MAKNPSEYFELIFHYLRNPEEREDLKKKQRIEVLKNHTYFTRIQGFLRATGYTKQAEGAQRKVEGLVNAVVQ